MTVFVFIMGKNPKCPRYNSREKGEDKLKYQNIFSTGIPSTTIAGAGEHPFNRLLASESCNVSLRCRPKSYRGCRPTHPIPVQCWDSVAAHCWFNADKPSTMPVQHYSYTVSALYLAAPVPDNICHLPDTVSMSAQRIRRCHAIETA